jgi:hypothetical protein
LAEQHPLLVAYAARAESYVLTDPNTALIKLRQFAELLAEQVADHCGIAASVDAGFGDVLRYIRNSRAVSPHYLARFHDLREAGNEAAHNHEDTPAEALLQLRNAHELAVWFHRRFRNGSFAAPPFQPPTRHEPASAIDRLRDLQQELGEQRREYQRLEAELRSRETQVAGLEGNQEQIRREGDRLRNEREHLLAERRQLADDTARVRDIEARLTAQSKKLEDNAARLEGSRKQLADYRQQLVQASSASLQQAERLHGLEGKLESQRLEFQRVEEELRLRMARVAELEGKHDQMEREGQRLSNERERLLAERRQLADDKAKVREIEIKLAAKSAELDVNQQRLEDNREQLVGYRKQLISFQQTVASDKAKLQEEVKVRTAQVGDLEKKNQQLRRMLARVNRGSVTSGPPDSTVIFSKRRSLLMAGVAAMLLLVGGVMLLIAYSKEPRRGNEAQQTTALAEGRVSNGAGGGASSATAPTPTPQQATIRAEDARKWLGKECTVELTVRSTRDLGWAIALNSKSPYTDPDNLSIVIVKEDAEWQFGKLGIANVEQHYRRGSVIQVTGKVEELRDKRTGKMHLEIKVRKPEQIKKP